MMWYCGMLLRYKKATESRRNNVVENVSIEVSLAGNLAMERERADHQPVVLFTKDNTGAEKPVPVVILPPERCMGGTIRHGIIGSKQVSWDPEISVYMITTVGIPLEEALADIGMKTRNVVIHM